MYHKIYPFCMNNLMFKVNICSWNDVFEWGAHGIRLRLRLAWFLSLSYPDSPTHLLLSPGDTYLINHSHLNPWLCVTFRENVTLTDGQMSELVTATVRIYFLGLKGAASHHSRHGSKVRVLNQCGIRRVFWRDEKTRVCSGQYENLLWTVAETDDHWPCVLSRPTFFP